MEFDFIASFQVANIRVFLVSSRLNRVSQPVHSIDIVLTFVKSYNDDIVTTPRVGIARVQSNKSLYRLEGCTAAFCN